MTSLFSQNDSTTIFYNWKLNKFYDIETYYLDTNIESFQIYDPAKIYSFSITFLGNPGQAFTSNIFYKKNFAPFVPVRSYYNYTFNPGNNFYFNTKKQYTNIFFIANTDKQFSEQDLKIVHTQNINPYMNFGIRYNLISSVGNYLNQKTANNSLSLFSSYKKKKLTVYATYNLNKFKVENNGGLVSDSNFTKLVEQQYPYTSFAVNLQNAYSIITFHNFDFLAKYKLSHNNDSINTDKATITELIYNFKSYNFRNKYFDSQSEYYQSYYYDSIETKDSIHQHYYTNSLFLKIKNNSYISYLPNIMAGAENLIHNYYYRWDRIHDTLQTTNALFAGLYNELKNKIYWQTSLKYYLSGYKTNDYIIDGLINYNFIKDTSFFEISAKHEISHPEISENLYYSNNFVWDTIFKPKTTSNIRLNYSNKKLNFISEIYLYNLSNYIYFDTLASPKQSNSDIQILCISLEKSFHFKHFHIINRIVYQKSSNSETIHLPDLNLFYSNYLDFKWIRKVLYTQIGFDIYYHSSFYADAFMPATSVFYLQNVKKTGNYPYIDIFANFKIKRARIFAKLEHVNSGLTGYNYFSAYIYPMYARVFKFGISWSFYD